MTPHCSAESSPFLRAGASQAAALGSSRGAEQLLLCFVPNPGGWILAVGLPNAAVRGPAGPLLSASRGCAFGGFFFFSFMHYIQEEMDCAGTAPEAILSLPGSQMHGHIACLSLARLGELQQV